MSEPVTALNGAAYDGLVRVAEQPRRGMITLRGDIATAGMRNIVTSLSGTAMPGQGRIELAGEGGLAWMSPDELMLILPADRVERALDRLASDLAGQHSLATEVTDARALFELTGEDAEARETLAKIAPVDFRGGAFGPGQFRRSRLAQIPAAFWCAAPGRFGVMCFRSVARYAFDVLSAAADPAGRVGHF